MGMPAMNKAAQSLGRLGGKAGTGASKARTSEQARAAVAARWAKNKRKPKRAARLPNAAAEARRTGDADCK